MRPRKLLRNCGGIYRHVKVWEISATARFEYEAIGGRLPESPENCWEENEFPIVSANFKDDIVPTPLPPPSPSEHEQSTEDWFGHHDHARLQVWDKSDEESKNDKESTKHTPPPVACDQMHDTAREGPLTLPPEAFPKDGIAVQKASQPEPGLSTPPGSIKQPGMTISHPCDDDVSSISAETLPQGSTRSQPASSNKRKRGSSDVEQTPMKRSRTESPLFEAELQAGGRKRKRPLVEDQIESKRSRTGVSENGGHEFPELAKAKSLSNVVSEHTHKTSGNSINPKTNSVGPDSPMTQGLDSARDDADKTERYSRPVEDLLYRVLSRKFPESPDETLAKDSKGTMLATDAMHPVAASYAKLERMEPYARKRTISKDGLVKFTKDKEFDRSKSAEARSYIPSQMLMNGYAAIGTHCRALSVEDPVADTAKIYFQDAVMSGSHDDLNTHAIAATCIGIACEVHVVNRDYRDIFYFVDVDLGEMERVISRLGDYFLPKDWRAMGIYMEKTATKKKKAKTAPLQYHPTMTPSYLTS